MSQELFVIILILTVILPSWYLNWRGRKKEKAINLEQISLIIRRQTMIGVVSTIVLSLAVLFGTNSDPGTAVAIIAILMLEFVLYWVSLIILLIGLGLRWMRLWYNRNNE